MSAYDSSPRARVGSATTSASVSTGEPVGRTMLSMLMYSAAVSPGVAVKLKSMMSPLPAASASRNFRKFSEPLRSLSSLDGLKRFWASSMIRTLPSDLPSRVGWRLFGIGPVVGLFNGRFVWVLPSTQNENVVTRDLSVAAPGPAHHASSWGPNLGSWKLFREYTPPPGGGGGGFPAKILRASAGK